MTREKIFNVPASVTLTLAVLFMVHGVREYLLSDGQDAVLLRALAFIPGRLTFAFDKIAVENAIESLPVGGEMTNALFLLGDGSPQWWTLVSYMLLHGNWTHLIVNSVWLLAFGTPVARRLGSLRFGLLFAVTGVAGALLHLAIYPLSLNPVVGASAGISGLMAAACRFVFQPNAPLGDRLGFGSDETGAYLQPAVPITRALTDRRVMPFVVLWFGVNILFGTIAPMLGVIDSPIAWEAHIGGFAAGLLLFSWFDPLRRAPHVDHG